MLTRMCISSLQAQGMQGNGERSAYMARTLLHSSARGSGWASRAAHSPSFRWAGLQRCRLLSMRTGQRTQVTAQEGVEGVGSAGAVAGASLAACAVGVGVGGSGQEEERAGGPGVAEEERAGGPAAAEERAGVQAAAEEERTQGLVEEATGQAGEAA